MYGTNVRYMINMLYQLTELLSADVSYDVQIDRGDWIEIQRLAHKLTERANKELSE